MGLEIWEELDEQHRRGWVADRPSSRRQALGCLVSHSREARNLGVPVNHLSFKS